MIEPARDAAALSFTLDDAGQAFVSTLMAAGVPLPEVAAYSGHSVGAISAVAADDRRLRSQATLTVFTSRDRSTRELALEAVETELRQGRNRRRGCVAALAS